MTLGVSGFSGLASQFASAVLLPVEASPSGATIFAGAGSRMLRKPGCTSSCGLI
jgi:hypothetical protein